MLDGLSQNYRTTLKFIYGHKFAGAMRFTNVTRTDHDRFATQRHHLRGFGAECNGSRFDARSLFEEFDQWRIRRSLEACILTVRIDLALKIRIGLRLFFNCSLEEIEQVLGRLCRDGTPFECEPAFAGEHVLR